MIRTNLFTWLVLLALICAGVAGSAATTTSPATYSWTEEFAGTPLDLQGYSEVFADDFTRPSVTADGGAGPWFAPVHSSYGVARFDVPDRDNDTYTISNGLLTIRATKAADGTWHGGNIQTVNQHGQGFAQQYGYFEARIKLPNALGAWPAFWLKSQSEYFDPKIVRPEIDVLEWYGGDPTGMHRTVHLWPPPSQYVQPGGLTKHWFKSNFSRKEAIAGEWHTYGALIGESAVTIYVDRVEVARFPTLDEYRVALYPLLSLTLYDKDASKAVSPIELQVDYVRIYARRRPAPPKDVEVRSREG